LTEEIVGWGHAIERTTTVSDSLARGLRELGIEYVFTIIGGGIAPLIDALQRHGLKIRHFRHEAGAAFAAHEASVASGKPVVVCVTTGPGIYNALTGIAAARADGGRILLLSGATSPAMRGKLAVQETGFETMPAELFAAGSLFHFAKIVVDARELPVVFARLDIGFQQREGFCAHLSLPLSLQDAPDVPFEIPSVTTRDPRASKQAIHEVMTLLAGRRFGLWVGHGARSAAKEIREFVDRTGCAVIATPRAKGVFPENDPHYVGVSGAGAHPSVHRYMNEFAPEVLIVIGTRMGEVSSFWSPLMIPPEGFVHVDIDTRAFGAAYPQAKALGICCDSRAFFDDLLANLPVDTQRQRAHDCTLPPSEHLTPRDEPLVRTPFLLQEIQRIIVDESNALVMSESGNAFAWANHALRFSTPERYRTSAAFGAMGHFVTGVVGAALGRQSKAVVLAGDGAMLMNNEINTAVTYQAQAIWIVLNDARFGLTEHGMQALELEPIETRMPRTNFALFAQSQGAQGRVVDRECDVADAIGEAMQADGPFVLDVRIDPNDVAPMLATRIASLKKQRSV
jgi:acetolactate synthase-1/2/3 large subunit